MNDKIKIAIIVNSFPKVSETFIYNKVVSLSNLGIEISVLYHNHNSDIKYFNKKELHNVKLHHISSKKNYFLSVLKSPFSFTASILSNFFNSKSFFKNLKNIILLQHFLNNDYNIIHFEFSGIAVKYLDILDKINCKKFVSCRGAYEQITPLINIERKVDLKKIFTKVDRIHCVSNDMKKTIQRYTDHNHKIFINYPSINLEKFKSSNQIKLPNHKKIILLSVGRLHWKKGLNYGIIAVDELLKRNYNVEYRIIGDGIEKEHLTFLIDNLGLNKNVKLLGYKKPKIVIQEMSNCNIFLLPSLSEGLSNSALEAMAMNLPVVCGNAGGMCEAINNGKNGIIANSMDPIDIADKIENLISDQDFYMKISTNSRKTIESKFDITKQIDIFYNEYIKASL